MWGKYIVLKKSIFLLTSVCLVILFQNCSSDTGRRSLSSCEDAGDCANFCESNPSHPSCIGALSTGCEYNHYPDGVNVAVGGNLEINEIIERRMADREHPQSCGGAIGDRLAATYQTVKCVELYAGVFSLEQIGESRYEPLGGNCSIVDADSCECNDWVNGDASDIKDCNIKPGDAPKVRRLRDVQYHASCVEGYNGSRKYIERRMQTVRCVREGNNLVLEPVGDLNVSHTYRNTCTPVPGVTRQCDYTGNGFEGTRKLTLGDEVTRVLTGKVPLFCDGSSEFESRSVEISQTITCLEDDEQQIYLDQVSAEFDMPAGCEDARDNNTCHYNDYTNGTSSHVQQLLSIGGGTSYRRLPDLKDNFECAPGKSGKLTFRRQRIQGIQCNRVSEDPKLEQVGEIAEAIVKQDSCQ